MKTTPCPLARCARFQITLAALLATLLVSAPALSAKNADLSNAVTNLSESPAATEPGEIDANPEIIAVGDAVHVFWFARHPDGGHKACYRRSLDRGHTWQPTYVFYQQDSAIRDPLVSNEDRHMAVVNGTVHIVFGAYGDNDNGWFGQLVYLRSPDNGATFGDPRVLWSSANYGTYTQFWLAYDVHVAAADGKLAICYRRNANWYDHFSAHVLISSDNGVTFSDSVSASAEENRSIEDFVFTGNMIGVLNWYSYYLYGLAGSRLYMSVSNDGGATYHTQLVAQWAVGSHDQHYTPVISCDSGRAHVLWLGHDEDSADPKHSPRSIYYRRSTDGGLTWDAKQDLVAGTGIPTDKLTAQHTLVTDGDLVFALIHTNNSKMFLRKSSDGGVTFGPAVEVTDPAGESLAVGAWWPVMKRVPTGTPGVTALDIVTTGLKRFRSLDDGASFQTSAVGPVFSLHNSNRPQFATDSLGKTHVVCEGKWTWYSTGVFGDLDTLYTRFDAAPATPSGTNMALQMVTQKNAGDGTGDERFDGMLVPDDGNLLPRSALTIECWVKSQPAAANEENYFIEKQGPGTGGAWETVLIGNYRAGQADVRLTTEDAGFVLAAGDPINDGEWHHISATYDSQQAGDNFFVYVDGQQIAATHATGLLKAGRGPLFLGGEKDQRTNGTVTLDDVRIWDRALGGEEIRARKDTVLSGSEDGLVAWFPLDASTRDASGNGHHGRLLYKESFVAGASGTPPAPTPVITSSTILNGSLGQALSYSILSTATATSYAADNLPAGLTCDTATGLISGTPTAAGIFTAHLTATGPDGTAELDLTINITEEETTVFSNSNIAGVLSNPPEPTTFELVSPTTITYLMDYHYFNGGTPPGTIALRHNDGTVYGPWQTEGRIGQGGGADAYWEVWPMVTLPAGTYTVVDSSPSTWSWNSQSDNQGITIIKGIGNSGNTEALLADWSTNCGLFGADADPEADPDGDGRPNWLEAAVGSHPMKANPKPVSMRTTDLGNQHAVSYTVCAGGSGVPGSNHLINGARIVIEVSPSLVENSWQPSVDLLDVAAAERILNGDGTETIIIPLRTPGGPFFARERMSQANEP